VSPISSCQRFGVAGRICALAVLLCLWPRPALAAGLSDEAFARIIVLLAAVSVGYVITHLAVEKLARRYSLAGGVEYVVLGVVLGPLLGILDIELARDIRPVLLLGAGALGMLAGLELGERGDVRVRGAWAAALSITSFTALTVIGLPMLGAWAFGYEIEADHAWTAALLFAGVVALGSDGAPIGALAALLGARGPAPALAVATANRVRALAILSFGLLFSMVKDTSILDLRPLWGAAQMLGVQVGAGVVLGLLFGVVVHRKLDERTLLTVVVGMVFLSGGFAYAMHASAIFVNFVAGLTFALTSPHAGEATRTMRSIKQPFVIALYFFAGLEWVGGELWVYAMIVPFLLLRWIGRKLGGAIGGRLAGSPANLGPATTAPGGLTLAFVLSIALMYRKTPGIIDAYGPLITALILLDLHSLRAVRRWLVDAAGIASEQVVVTRR
jgi:Kef-type K+ transport system membrane component KefB